MVSSGGGVIVNTASVAGMLGPRNMWWTTVEGQARCKLLAATGKDREVSEDERKEMQEHSHAGRHTTEKAGPATRGGQCRLCSQDASYLTGTVLPVDGGRLP